MKEFQILNAVPNIKTNPTTYNLSYGIPPLSKDDMPTEEYLTWFRDQIDSGIWDQDPESVKATMVNGILDMTIEKKEKTSAKKVEIE